MSESRIIEPLVRRAAKQMPVLVVTGPRQSGKTTLCLRLFANKPYVNLEPHDTRAFATEDPRGFLAQYPKGAVIDEAQQVPTLASYLQAEVDDNPKPGRFILTGSQNLALSQQVSQSLAGRAALFNLLPLSLDELKNFRHAPQGLWPTVWAGSYPRIHALGLPADRWLADYLATYVERDVRQLLKVGDLASFRSFLKLAAARTGQEINLTSLGGDAGVSHNTAKAWLSVLEAGFILHRLPPWFTNLNLRWVKSAKLHFVDSGVVCSLLGIQTPEQLAAHPLRGAIFETWVVSEVLKHRLNRGKPAAALHHLRQVRGLEIDLLIDEGKSPIGLEVKSSATLHAEQFKALTTLGAQTSITPRLVFGGSTSQKRTAGQAIAWDAVQQFDW